MMRRNKEGGFHPRSSGHLNWLSGDGRIWVWGLNFDFCEGFEGIGGRVSVWVFERVGDKREWDWVGVVRVMVGVGRRMRRREKESGSHHFWLLGTEQDFLCGGFDSFINPSLSLLSHIMLWTLKISDIRKKNWENPTDEKIGLVRLLI